jgi:SWI/SNF-related matrix-associated actin-dependent regulator 1 of chromatin subfamily A
MMLRFNETNNSFLLYTHDSEKAEAAGLTLSTSARGSKGEKVYFTADSDKRPVFNPYAVIDFHEQADAHTAQYLAPLIEDYQASWADSCDEDFPVPDGLNYLPYQKAGIKYALDRSNCVIGDEPGLGKTIQAIGVANAMGARNVLVLCPASIRLNWAREIREWSIIEGLMTRAILKGSDQIMPSAHYIICSYDLTRKLNVHKALQDRQWDMIVADEGHYLKSTEAARTRAMFGGGDANNPFHNNGLAQYADKIVALTGTPLPNRPRECYTLARGLNWEAIDMMSYDRFTYRYNPSKKVGYRNIEMKGRLPELNARLRSNMMVRRHKKDVLPQLPDKRYEMTYIEPNGAIKVVLARESLIDFDPEDLFNSDFTLGGTPVSTLRREMGEAMAPRVVDYVEYILKVVEREKVVLFAHHTSVIKYLAQALAKYGVVIHVGGTSSKAKDAAVASFRDGKPRIFLGQLDTMEGVDGLQRVCSDVIFAEPAWTPGRNEQCVDRCHRLGQHDNVLAHFLLVEGSFNEKVLNFVLNKAVDIHETLDRRLV